MSAWDAYLRLNTPKLHVPTEFIPTRPHDRGWIIPFFGKNQLWTIPLAIVPAIIATILIFMDQQITAVIINRKEYQLKVTATSRTLHVTSRARLEKSRLPSRSAHPVVYDLDPIDPRLAVVRGSDCARPHSRQRLETHERKFRAWRNTEISGYSVRDAPLGTPSQLSTHFRSSEQRVSALLMAILTGLSVFLAHVLNVSVTHLARQKTTRLSCSIFQCPCSTACSCSWASARCAPCRFAQRSFPIPMANLL